MKSPYREEIEVAAARYQLDPLLVESVVWQESAGHADAFRFEPGYWERYCKERAKWRDEDPRRIASSYGLMQIMYPTALDYGYAGPPEGLFHIPRNLAIGCQILADLIKRMDGDIEKALAAYNGGVGGVFRSFPQAYARRVVDRYERLTAAREGRDRQGQRT